MFVPMTEKEILEVLSLAREELHVLYKQYAADVLVLGESQERLDKLKEEAMKICEKYAVEVKREGEIK